MVDLKPIHRGRPADIGRASLQHLYAGPRTINKKKLLDLKELLDFIPPVHHSFYQNLDQAGGDDPDESEEEGDEEEGSEDGDDSEVEAKVDSDKDDSDEEGVDDSDEEEEGDDSIIDSED